MSDHLGSAIFCVIFYSAEVLSKLVTGIFGFIDPDINKITVPKLVLSKNTQTYAV